MSIALSRRTALARSCRRRPPSARLPPPRCSGPRVTRRPSATPRHRPCRRRTQHRPCPRRRPAQRRRRHRDPPASASWRAAAPSPNPGGSSPAPRSTGCRSLARNRRRRPLRNRRRRPRQPRRRHRAHRHPRRRPDRHPSGQSAVATPYTGAPADRAPASHPAGAPDDPPGAPPRRHPSAASAPLARPRSLLRRALAALTQRSRAGQPPADGVARRQIRDVQRHRCARRPRWRGWRARTGRRRPPDRAGGAPRTPPPRPEQPAARPLARLASASPPSSPSPQPWTPPDDVAPRALSPQPPMRAPAEPSSQQLSRAPAPGVSPTSHETTPSAPTDPDLAYRDLLTRVREEREQLGQLISHPF